MDQPSSPSGTATGPISDHQRRRRQQLKCLEIMEFRNKRLMKPKLGGVADQPVTKYTCLGNTSQTHHSKPKGVKLIRTKERTISEIVEKVSVWRKLYNGIAMPNPEAGGRMQLMRYSLEDAAAMVEVSKKSLDDYLLQLRAGRIYGFDFVKHGHDKVGVLRNFVKQQKLQHKKQKKSSKKSQLKGCKTTTKGSRGSQGANKNRNNRVRI